MVKIKVRAHPASYLSKVVPPLNQAYTNPCNERAELEGHCQASQACNEKRHVSDVESKAKCVLKDWTTRFADASPYIRIFGHEAGKLSLPMQI